ncbi:FIST N-terminal domain-containing protein [Acidithiobacillus sp.]|uniref:FIST signal transduction protein n=1 Tax=Acidithiobacillus sp. TaxID=1872118 RepID=UPI0025C4C201|nr:FIST N-terminal domain-containing protein [Acidithiobacillus sp.]
MKHDSFPYGHAAGEDWSSTLTKALATIPEDFPATLGFLYVTDGFEADLPAILSALQQRFPGVAWVGSIGIGICATSTEYLDEKALALMLTDLPREDFQVFHGMAPYGTEGWKLANGSAPFFAVVHGDPHSGDLSAQVADLASRTSSGFLVGGVSSSRAEGAQIAGDIVHGGLSGVVLSERVAVVTRLTQGCSPIGPVHRVQEAQRNIIATLDRHPALEVLYAEVGEILARDIRRAAGFIFAALPVSGDDRGDYLVRNLVGVDQEHGLVAIGELVEPGQELMFCKRDAETARNDLARMLTDIDALRAGREIRGALYFSCLGRGESLFGPDSAELRQIAASLGPVPLVGFFANGEISRDRIYGYTGVLTLFLA